MTLKTEFCIIGFPKCGTSALIRFLDGFSRLHVARNNKSVEAPFYFNDAKGVPEGAYVPGKLNGHKFSAYVYNPKDVNRIYQTNPDVLFIACVRDARESLLSWHNMHKKTAASSGTGHFTQADDETRKFYQNCSVAEYFESYAYKRLDYERRIQLARRSTPNGRFLFVSQQRCATDPVGVVSRIVGKLGLSEADNADGFSKLPKEAVVSFGSKKVSGLSEDISAKLNEYNHLLRNYLHKSVAPEDRVIIEDAGETGF